PLTRSVTRWAMPAPPNAACASVDHALLAARSASARLPSELLVVADDVDVLLPVSPCSHATRAMTATAAPIAPATARVVVRAPRRRRVGVTDYLAGWGSLGRPSTRSPTMLRITSSVPPATRMLGTPRTNSDHENV